MTSASTEEQTKAGLQNLTQNEYEQFSSLNGMYMEKFPFPFILAVRGKQKKIFTRQCKVAYRIPNKRSLLQR